MDNKDFLPIFAQFQMLWKLLQTKDNYDSSVAQQARFCSADFLLPRNKGVEALNVMCRRFVFIAEKKELFNDDINKSLMNEIVNYLFVEILTGQAKLTSWLDNQETFNKNISIFFTKKKQKGSWTEEILNDRQLAKRQDDNPRNYFWLMLFFFSTLTIEYVAMKS